MKRFVTTCSSKTNVHVFLEGGARQRHTLYIAEVGVAVNRVLRVRTKVGGEARETSLQINYAQAAISAAGILKTGQKDLRPKELVTSKDIVHVAEYHVSIDLRVKNIAHDMCMDGCKDGTDLYKQTGCGEKLCANTPQ